MRRARSWRSRLPPTAETGWPCRTPSPHEMPSKAPLAVDRVEAQRAIADLLVTLGGDSSSEHLGEVPKAGGRRLRRVPDARAVRRCVVSERPGHDELIVARAIPVRSLCEHHLLPFTGWAHVGYLLDRRILGLSKLGRVVELFARRLQIQERLTCMTLRGVRAQGSTSHLGPAWGGAPRRPHATGVLVRGGSRAVLIALDRALKRSSRTSGK
jgi:GTP cyclohydrolase I